MKQTCVALALFLAASTAGLAGELKGVQLPDTTQVGGAELTLNGMGLREATALKVDVYVAGLYVESTSKDATELLDAGGAWKIEMHFVRKKVGKKSIADAWSSGFEKNVEGHEAMTAKIEKLNGMMSDVRKGDVLAFTHDPAQGLIVSKNGTDLGTIEGADFARGMLAVFIGPKPPNSGLKEGLLGR